MKDLNIDATLNSLENALDDIQANIRDTENALETARDNFIDLQSQFKELPEQSEKYAELVAAIRKVVEEFQKLPPF